MLSSDCQPSCAYAESRSAGQHVCGSVLSSDGATGLLGGEDAEVLRRRVRGVGRAARVENRVEASFFVAPQ